MQAPANHGSALAQLGKGRIARMKFFANGVEPGTGVLDWLEHRGTLAALKRYLEPNQTLMVEIGLKRHVVEGVFQLTQNLAPAEFKQQARGAELP